MKKKLKELKIIVNADDLGNSKVSDAIIDLLKKKIVTSASLLANGPAFDGVISQLKAVKIDSVGVHLNLTDHKPITQNRYLECLLDENGCFCRKIFKIRLTSKLKNAIFLEFCAQINQIKSTGLKISHIDSHEHIHTMPELFFILKKIQKTLGIYKVRNTRNFFTSVLPQNNIKKRVKKRCWQIALKTYLPTKTTQGFTDFITFYNAAMLAKVNYSTIELMTHPGNNDHIEENKILCSDWIAHLPYKITLIDYNML